MTLTIALADEDGPVLLDLAALVFVACDEFERGPMLLKPGEVVARSWRRPFERLKHGVRDYDGHDHRAVEHGKLHAFDGLMRRLRGGR